MTEFSQRSNIDIDQIKEIDVMFDNLDASLNIYKNELNSDINLNIYKNEFDKPNNNVKFIKKNIYDHKKKYSDIVDNIEDDIYSTLQSQQDELLNDLKIYKDKKNILKELKSTENTLLTRIKLFENTKLYLLFVLWIIIIFILFIVLFINTTDSSTNMNDITKIILFIFSIYICYKVYNNVYLYFSY